MVKVCFSGAEGRGAKLNGGTEIDTRAEAPSWVSCSAYAECVEDSAMNTCLRWRDGQERNPIL